MKNLARKLALLALIPAFTVSTSASAVNTSFKGTVWTARMAQDVAITVVDNTTDSMFCLVPGPPTPATAGMMAMLATAKVGGKVVTILCDPTSQLVGVLINN